jgi:GT2 family glycosyltransferase
MLNQSHKICVLTVTYGARWQFLEQVLRRAVTLSYVSHIVVVDNASTYNVDDKVKNEIDDNRISVITNNKNEGSAGGYKMAMKYAIQNTDADMLFLLDDDNVPAENVIDELLYKWENIRGEDNKKALFCLREDRIQHLMIARGENPYRFYLVPDNFLGFNVFRVVHNQFYKLCDKFKKQLDYKSHAPMPYVPYGGLLLHRSIIKDIGYPEQSFFLYVDDSEYTYRITQNGGIIWLIPSCKVVDVDKSQGLTYKRKLFHSHLLDLWSFRTYYHIRNRIYFYSICFIKNRFIFKLNKLLYLNYLKVIGMLSSKTAEYNKLLVAINDGLKGNLGPADESKF